MFSGYNKLMGYFKALPIIYGAKRRAEVAPGVGRESDFFFITKNGFERVHEKFIEIIAADYELEELRKLTASIELEGKLTKYLEEAAAAEAAAAEALVNDGQASGEPISLSAQLSTPAEHPPEAPGALAPEKIHPRSPRRRSRRHTR